MRLGALVEGCNNFNIQCSGSVLCYGIYFRTKFSRTLHDKITVDWFHGFTLVMHGVHFCLGGARPSSTADDGLLVVTLVP